MHTCPNCGTQYEKPGKFCTNCGTPLEASESAAADTSAGYTADAPKAKKPLTLIIAGAAALVAIIAALIVLLGGALKSPADKFVEIQKTLLFSPLANAAENYVTGVNSAEVSYSNDMTLTVNSKLDEYYYGEVNELLKAISLDIQVKLDKDGAIIGLGLNRDGETVLSGLITSDEEKLGVSLPEADKNYYVITTESLLEELPDNNSEELAKELETLLTKDTFLIISEMCEIVSGCVTKENTTKEKAEIELTELGETVDCTVYTFTPNAEDISTMIKALADYLENSKEAKELVFAFARFISTANGYEYTEEDLADLESEYDSFVDTMKDNADDIGEDIEASSFSWRVAVDGKRVHLEEIAFDDYGDEVSIRYESFGEEKERSDAIILDDTYDHITLVNEYEKDGKTLDGKFSFSDGYEEFDFRYDINTAKKSALGIFYGEYSLSYYGERVCKLTVDVGTDGGSDHKIAVTTYDGDLIINLHSSDKKSDITKPAGPAVDISNYTDDEIYTLFEEIGFNLVTILYESFPEFFYYY